MPAIADARILILSDNGFEQSELFEPLDQLQAKGATVEVATPDGDAIEGWDEDDWGDSVDADLAIGDVVIDNYDALVLPGGQMNPDLLRINAGALAVIRGFADAGKPIAAICHAPWLLIETGLIKGRRATSYASIKTDMINAGADWVDDAAVTDGLFVTSRNPGDLDAFVEAITALVEAQPAAAAPAGVAVAAGNDR